MEREAFFYLLVILPDHAAGVTGQVVGGGRNRSGGWVGYCGRGREVPPRAIHLIGEVLQQDGTVFILDDNDHFCHLGIIHRLHADGLPGLAGPAAGIDLQHLGLTEPVGDGEIVRGGIRSPGEIDVKGVIPGADGILGGLPEGFLLGEL